MFNMTYVYRYNIYFIQYSYIKFLEDKRPSNPQTGQIYSCIHTCKETHMHTQMCKDTHTVNIIQRSRCQEIMTASLQK